MNPCNLRLFAASLAIAALLPACTTMRAGSVDRGALADPGVRAPLARAVDGLRALVTDLAAPAAPGERPLDLAGEVARIEQARLSVIAAGAVQLDQPGLSTKAELATLAILLTLCRDRVRAVHGLEAGSAPAKDAARSIAMRCVAPLALMLG